jgi:hypothetical protein
VSSVPRETVAGSLLLAVASVAGGAVTEHLTAGVGLAAGLVIGCFNSHALAALLERGTPFVASTIVRLAAVSAVAIAVAFLLRSEAWAVLLGVAAAQGVMVAAAVRQGLRA